MQPSSQSLPEASPSRPVLSGKDQFDEQRGLGVSSIHFKVSGQDSDSLLILENVFHAKGGPGRHLHHAQDEWFHVLEGDFIVEIGEERYHLSPGDALFTPRKIPHVWAYVGDAVGKILIVFSPAGQMEAFFREVTKANAMPPQDPALWRAHGMELVGPPLSVA